eukprot:Em0019g847a
MDDQEQFRADLSLLPQVLKLCKALCASGQNDQQLILNAMTEMQTQVQKYQQALDSSPFLDCTPEEQAALLASKKQQLKQKCNLLVKFRELPIIAASAVYR